MFTGVCLSTAGSLSAVHGLCMMSLPVWLPSPMFYLGGSASRGSVCLHGGLHWKGEGIRKTSALECFLLPSFINRLITSYHINKK